MEDKSNISSPTGQTYEFCNPQKITGMIVLAFGVSFMTIIMMAVIWYLMFLSPSSNALMPGLMGGMSVVPVFGIGAGIYLLKRPRKILVGPYGLVVIGLIGQKAISWRTVADVEIKEEENLFNNMLKPASANPDSKNKCIILRNKDKKKIIAIDSSFENFDSFTAMVISYSSQSQGQSVYDDDRQKNRIMKKRKRTLRFNLGLGIFFVLFSIAMAIFITMEYRNERMLENHAETAEAAIVKHYMYNITPRVEYSFTLDGKSYTNNVEFKKAYWAQLEEGGVILVKYVPSNPGNNRPLEGYVKDFDIPYPIMFIASVAMVGLGLLFIGMYFLKIVDIKQDGGKFKIVRLNDLEPAIAPSMPVAAAIPQYQNIQAPAIPSAGAAVQSLYRPAAVQEKTRLPGGLKAIGILNIVFGAISTVFNGFRILIVLAYMKNPESFPIAIDVSKGIGWLLAGHSLALLCALALCVSGIGILRFANWGRILALAAVSVRIVMGLWEMAAMFRTPVSAENLGTEEAYVFKITSVFYGFFILLVLIYPLIVFVLLSRRSTREQFQKTQ